nr:MAG TPA: hypothetical protein [Caudoviricetes sp.]
MRSDFFYFDLEIEQFFECKQYSIEQKIFNYCLNQICKE